MPESFHYFAYGSNMLTRRLRAKERAPNAIKETVGYVEGRRLAFHKVSKDGSGKCDIEATGNATDRVYGVVSKIPKSEDGALDRAEGLDEGYRKEEVRVETARGTMSAWAYVATKKEPACRPYHWYKAFVVAGAVEHDLPPAYVEWLRTADSMPDPNEKRRAKEEALLFENE